MLLKIGGSVKPKEFREIREGLGLTQQELADIFGLSGYIPINHYESGFRNPSGLIVALMKIFREWNEKKSLELREELKTQAALIRKSKRKKT
jgi:DNA-binding transcriptional regulator YiaG